MDWLLSTIAANRPYVDLAHAVSSTINVVGWTIGLVLLFVAWRRNRVQSISVGPINFRMQEEAVVAAAVAARDWRAKEPGSAAAVDVGRIRATVGRAFAPEVADRLVGKSILWVDDNPANNMLLVRTFSRLQLDVEQVASTEAALAAIEQRRFDLVISDMGRGADMRAGYGLLQAIRATGSTVPYLIFAGSDSPRFRREAKELGAQLSTNDMVELIDEVVARLGT